MTNVDKIKSDSLSSVEAAIKNYRETVEAVDFWKDIVENLPESECYISNYFGVYHSSITYYPTENEDAESLRSKVQLVTKKIAKRNFGEHNGKISYEFKINRPFPSGNGEKTLTINVNNGKPSQTCQIIESMVEVKRFKMICPEEEKVEA